MKIFNSILGVFSILGAVYCIFYPGVTFLNSGWIIAMLLGVKGICSIFEYASGSNKDNKALMANGVIGLIMGILAAIVAILAIFVPQIVAIFDIIILIMFTIWLVYSGTASIFRAVALKKQGKKIWIFTLIMGIIVAVTGVYAAVHWLMAAYMLGTVIGISLMIYGFRLIASIFEDNV